MRKTQLTVVNEPSVSITPPEVPLILTDPKGTCDKLQNMAITLGSVSGTLREALRLLTEDSVGGEMDRLRVYGSQQPPGWADRQIANHAMHIVDTVNAFVDQVDEAKALLAAVRTPMETSVERIKEEQAKIGTLVALERVNEFEQQVKKVELEFGKLNYLVEQAATWLPIAKASAARTAEAAGRVISSMLVIDMTTALRQLSDRITALRAMRSPALEEVLVAIQKAERLNSEHIRIPDIVWSEGGDMFDPPRLREWGTD